MKENNVARLVEVGELTSANDPESVVLETLPAYVRAAIAQGQKAFAKTQRFEVDYNADTIRSMSVEQKLQHIRDGVLNALARAAKEGRGQPPMVERFRAAVIIVDWLEHNGVPFGVGRNSRMNKALLGLLNDMAERSMDDRKSRRKKITADAVRELLRQIKKLRLLSAHFVNLCPYAD
jgi:hypothetical protein